MRERRPAGVGRGDPQRRPAHRLPRGRRPRHRALRAPARAAAACSPRSRARIRTHRRCCSWATPTSCRSTSTAGRATRSAASSSTAWCGAAARSTCSTSPRRWRSRSAQLADSGFKPKGTISYLAVADEEARGIWGADWLIDHELDDVKADYVITESGGFQVPTANGAAAPGDGRGEGHLLVEAHGPRHAGPRVVAVPDRQRARHRGRGRAPARRVPGAAGAERDVAAAGRGARPARTSCSQEEAFRETIDQLPLGLGAHRALVHAHDVRADGRARRHEDERDPGPGATSRSTSARCPARAASTREKMLLEAIGDLIDKVEIESGDDPASRSEIDTPLWDALGPRDRAAVRGLRARAVAHDRRDRQPLLPAGRVGRLRLRALQQAARRSRTTPRCSTATTSGSTRRASPLDRSLARDRRGVRRPARRADGATRGPARAGTPRTPRPGRRRSGSRPRSASSASAVVVGLLLERAHVVAHLVVVLDRAVDPRPPRLAGHAELAQVERPPGEDRERARAARASRAGSAESRRSAAPAPRTRPTSGPPCGTCRAARRRCRSGPRSATRSSPSRSISAVVGGAAGDADRRGVRRVREQRAERHDGAAAGLVRDLEHGVAEAAPAAGSAPARTAVMRSAVPDRRPAPRRTRASAR